PRNASQRYVGTLGEPNALAAFAVFLWPFSFFAIKKFGKFERVAAAVLLFLVLLILLFSGSKSALIAFGIQLLMLILQKCNLSIKKAVLICLFFFAISYALPFFEHIPYENRVEVWQSALFAGNSNPLFGHGFGNTEIALHSAAAHLNLPIQYY